MVEIKPDVRITRYREDTLKLSFLFQNPDGTVMDISGQTPEFYLKQNKEDIYTHLDPEVTIDSTGMVDGELVITVARTGMELLKPGIYDFILKFTESVPETQVLGELELVDV